MQCTLLAGCFTSVDWTVTWGAPATAAVNTAVCSARATMRCQTRSQSSWTLTPCTGLQHHSLIQQELPQPHIQGRNLSSLRRRPSSASSVLCYVRRASWIIVSLPWPRRHSALQAQVMHARVTHSAPFSASFFQLCHSLLLVSLSPWGGAPAVGAAGWELGRGGSWTAQRPMLHLHCRHNQRH
jgi:hypothetical protein